MGLEKGTELENLMEQAIEHYSETVTHLQIALDALRGLNKPPMKGSRKKKKSGWKKEKGIRRTSFRLEEDEEDILGKSFPVRKTRPLRSKTEIAAIRRKLLEHFEKMKGKPQRVADLVRKLKQPYGVIYNQASYLVTKGRLVKVSPSTFKPTPSRKRTPKPTQKGPSPKERKEYISDQVLAAIRKHCKGEFTSKDVLAACKREKYSYTQRQIGDVMVRFVLQGLIQRQMRGLFLLV